VRGYGRKRLISGTLFTVSTSVYHTVFVLMTGFDMSTMGTSYFDEGQIDINEASEVVTNEFIIKVCISCWKMAGN
jgi:hypothetical protein